jgi:hypothetical protein
VIGLGFVFFATTLLPGCQPAAIASSSAFARLISLLLTAQRSGADAWAFLSLTSQVLRQSN